MFSDRLGLVCLPVRLSMYNVCVSIYLSIYLGAGEFAPGYRGRRGVPAAGRGHGLGGRVGRPLGYIRYGRIGTEIVKRTNISSGCGVK